MTQTPDTPPLLEFPCRFPIKIMGAAHPEFTRTVLEVTRIHALRVRAWPAPSAAGGAMRPNAHQAVTHRSLGLAMPTVESSFPDFFADAPQLTLRDPLAEFLGAARGGLMTYRYADAVRLAGHSCPTVAGAWLMAVRGLRALYGEETPVRGEIGVFMQGGREDGANGVIATVVQLITGAAPETGFHGIGGRFARHQLLRFDQPVQGTLGLRRTHRRGQTISRARGMR